MAYDDLLSITLQENESLSGLISRVEDAVNKVQLLRPATYTLAKLDDELAAMALIRSLPYEQYGSFRSSLMLMADVKFTTVKEAFLQEQRNRQPRAGEHSMALKTATAAILQIPLRVRCSFFFFKSICIACHQQFTVKLRTPQSLTAGSRIHAAIKKIDQR